MKQFNSKIGLEFFIPVALIVGYFLYKTIIDSRWVGLLIIIPAIVFIAYLFFSIKYIISGKTLEIKCGFLINKSIDIGTIRRIREVTDFFAAPATTINRLEIKYNDSDSIAISPKNKLDFIETLLKVNPGIEIQKKDE